MSRQILAVDIRNDFISAVLLNTGIKNSSIQAGLCMPFDNASIDTGSAQLSEALESVIQQMQASGANVVVSIPADEAIFRTLCVPFNEHKKIRQILPFELEPILAQPVDTLIIDFLPTNNGSGNEILAVAIDQKTLNTYIDSLESAQIRPQLVVPGAFPLVTTLIAHMQELPDQAVFIDIGTHKSTIFIIVERHTALVRTFSNPMGSQQTAVETIATNVRQTLTSFSDSQAIEFKPSAIFLSGSGLTQSPAFERLSEVLQIPTQLVDIRSLLPKIDMDKNLQNWQPLLMDNALSLGLLEAESRPCPNFHRSSSLLRNYWTAYRSYIRGPAVLCFLVLLLWIGGVLVDSHLLQKQIDQIDRQIEDLFKSVLADARRVGDPLDQMRSEIKKLKSSGIDAGLNTNSVRSVDVIYQVSNLIPQDIEVEFNRMIIGENEVTISGETASFKVVDDIKVRLEQSDIFKEVTIASANMDKSGNKVRFKLTIDL